MRYIISCLLLFINLFGAFEDVNTFNAEFKQTIVNEQNKKIEYEGVVYIKRPGFAFWEYQKPILKQVYLIEKEVVIIEPELEQVIVTEVDGAIDFLKILNDSKKISSDLYETLIKDQKYLLFIENDLLKRVQFIDKMDNRVDIEFFNQKKNSKIEERVFEPIIPEEFDIIKEN